jgi:hypothetical protein
MLHQLRQFLFSAKAVWFYVATNAAVFVALSAWIFCDARFGESAARLRGQLSSPRAFANDSINDAQLAHSLAKLQLLVVVAVASGAAIVAAAILGPPRVRRIHFWLGLCFIAAVWLALWATWSDLMWSGQVFRLKRATSSFQPLTLLYTSWPDSDGSRSDIGPFNAYPNPHPRTLQLLTERRSTSGVSFSQIERLADGLGFRLTGRDLGAWLEWRPSHDMPQSFVGGLSQRFDLEKYAPLGNDWFVVRYR